MVRASVYILCSEAALFYDLYESVPEAGVEELVLIKLLPCVIILVSRRYNVLYRVINYNAI